MTRGGYPPPSGEEKAWGLAGERAHSGPSADAVSRARARTREANIPHQWLHGREPRSKLRHLRPLGAVEQSAPRLRRPAPPLLQEEGDSCCEAAITETAHPLLSDRAVTVSRLTPGDEPVVRVEHESIERSEQRLRAHEANGGGHLPQAIGAMHPAVVLTPPASVFIGSDPACGLCTKRTSPGLLRAVARG